MNRADGTRWLRERLIHLPKAELHVHLEATIQPATLLMLAERNEVALPAETLEDLQRWFVYRDFEHFRQIYRSCARCLVTSEDYELVTYEFGREMARQNIRYAEARFGPTTPHFRGIPQQTYMDGLTAGRRRALDDFGVRINWIFELGRGPDQDTKAWDYTTRVAIEGKGDGVVALGLAGPEYQLTTESFAPWFDQARAVGLHSAPHAGEFAGPESIWSAIRYLGAERIGHGVRAIEDPALMTYLAREGIPLEVSPTSNIRLGLYRSIAEHPLRRLYEAGVVVTVNSDDPALFHTSLTDELCLLHGDFGLDVDAIDEIVRSGILSSFLPVSVKDELAAELQREGKGVEL